MELAKTPGKRTTPQGGLVTNITKKYHEPSDLEGFDELRPEDQAQINTVYQTGSVADKDILKPEDKEHYEKCVGCLKSSHVPTDRV